MKHDDVVGKIIVVWEEKQLLECYGLQVPAVLVNNILLPLLGMRYWFCSDTKCALWSTYANEPCEANCDFFTCM